MKSSTKPELVIRLGSHAEKEYVTKLARYLDGMIVGANLFESAPGATASLFVAMGAKRMSLYIDPMTYAFGAYVDPATGKRRTDLDWIKSDQTQRKAGAKVIVRAFKRSYKELASALGSPIQEALGKGKAVSPSDLGDGRMRERFCRRVADYQVTRVAAEFTEDAELKSFAEDAPKTSAIFAPYFYIEPTQAAEWLAANVDLLKTTAALELPAPVHGIVCADSRQLVDADFLRTVIQAARSKGVAGMWLWFSGLFEDSADEGYLRQYKEFVTALSESVSVYALHGGFFSMALSKFGMRGVSHGIGYGEQKDVVPVIGQSTPTVRYYLPGLARRLGVPQIERAFDAMGIKTARDFHQKVCDCAVCKGVVVDGLSDFASFGEMHYSRPTATRQAQTPAAAKRCRFHFLLTRIRERDRLRTGDLDDITNRLSDGEKTWGAQASLTESARHLGRWRAVLRRDGK